MYPDIFPYWIPEYNEWPSILVKQNKSAAYLDWTFIRGISSPFWF